MYVCIYIMYEKYLIPKKTLELHMDGGCCVSGPTLPPPPGARPVLKTKPQSLWIEKKKSITTWDRLDRGPITKWIKVGGKQVLYIDR